MSVERERSDDLNGWLLDLGVMLDALRVVTDAVEREEPLPRGSGALVLLVMARIDEHCEGLRTGFRFGKPSGVGTVKAEERSVP